MASWELTSYFCSAQGVVFIFVYLSNYAFVALLCIERVVKVRNEGFYETLFEPKWKPAVIAFAVWILNLGIAAIPLSGWIEISYDTYQAACIPKLSRSLYYLVGIFVVSLGVVFIVGVCTFPCILNTKIEKQKRKSKESNSTDNRTKEFNANKLKGTKQDMKNNSGDTKSTLKPVPKNTGQSELDNTMNLNNEKSKGILIQLNNAQRKFRTVTKTSRKIFLENSNDEFQLAVTNRNTNNDSSNSSNNSHGHRRQNILLVGAVSELNYSRKKNSAKRNETNTNDNHQQATNLKSKENIAHKPSKDAKGINKTTGMNGSSNYRKQEYNNPIQNTAMNGSSNYRKIEYNNVGSNPSQGNDISDKSSSQHHTGIKTILVHNGGTKHSTEKSKHGVESYHNNNNTENQYNEKYRRPNERKKEYNNLSQSTVMDGSSNDRKKEYNNPSQSTVMNGNSNDRKMEYNNPSQSTVMNGNSNDRKKEYNNPSQSTVMNGSSNDRKKEYNNPSQSTFMDGSSNDRKKEYNNPSQSTVMNGCSNDTKKEYNNPSQSTFMNGSSNDRKNEYNNPGQSTVMNGSSNDRKKEYNNPSQSTFMDGSSNDRKKEYNNPSQSTVMNGSSNDRKKEYNNPSQSTVMNGCSNDRKKEYNNPSQSTVINGSSNDRKKEYNNPSQSTVMNGSSNDRKKEYNNPSQSTVMNGISNDRKKEYNNPSQSTVKVNCHERMLK
ncbi:unnamed protein product [Mytilus coruscus]|uniref:G-protein coupled receptors family 1 profile domain-containing protein n=1 Tax=Mytilus coruscus TaxID=42192 RepID=A0A6J8E2F1_MYTCO|nr:unnamed protein product [Mytilus coruscus]